MYRNLTAQIGKESADLGSSGFLTELLPTFLAQ